MSKCALEDHNAVGDQSVPKHVKIATESLAIADRMAKENAKLIDMLEQANENCTNMERALQALRWVQKMLNEENQDLWPRTQNLLAEKKGLEAKLKSLTAAMSNGEASNLQKVKCIQYDLECDNCAGEVVMIEPFARTLFGSVKCWRCGSFDVEACLNECVFEKWVPPGWEGEIIKRKKFGDADDPAMTK